MDPVKLHEELTRYQFYLQIKKDLFTTRLPCAFDSASLLASYIMQGTYVCARSLVIIHYPLFSPHPFLYPYAPPLLPAPLPLSPAELGDYDPRKHPEGYVSQFPVIPKQSVNFDERVAHLHRSLSGKTTTEAEYLFLAYARR